MERLTRNKPVVLLGAAFAAIAVVTLVLASKMTFYADTWELLMNRRDPTVDTLLQPHNEHLVMFPVLFEELILRLFGMTSAMPEYVLLVIFLVATAGLLYVYLERRVGSWLALFGAVILLCLGPAWEVLLFPFEITFVGPMMFGLAMLLLLEREDRGGDLGACACLVAALGFSGAGVAFIAAAAVAILIGPREDWLRRAYVFVVPAVLFAVWYLGWGHDAESHISLHNILASPRFVADSIAVAVGGLVGLGSDPASTNLDPVWGRAILVALVILLAWRQLRRPGFDRGLWPVAAAATVSWFLTAFNAMPGGRIPTASRYEYAGAIFVLLIVANLLKDVRLSGRAIWVGAGLTALAIAPNLVVLKQGANYLRGQAVLTRSDTAALEIASKTVDPSFQLTPEIAGTPVLVNILAGEYLQAVDEYGSPAYTPTELAETEEPGRRQADVILAGALPLSTFTTPGTYAAAAAPGCEVVADGDPAEVQLGPGTTRIELAPGPHAGFTLRRFAVGEFPVITEGADGESVTKLRIPADNAPDFPWYLHVEAEQEARVCPAGGG